jgi:hypothetical protein
VLVRSLTSLPVELSSIVGHAIAGVVRDVVLVESALPVQKVIDESIGVGEDFFLRPFERETTRRNIAASLILCRQSTGNCSSCQSKRRCLVDSHHERTMSTLERDLSLERRMIPSDNGWSPLYIYIYVPTHYSNM